MSQRLSSRLRRAALAATLGIGLVVPLAGAAMAMPGSAPGVPVPPPSPTVAGKPSPAATGWATAAGLRAYLVITDPGSIATGKKAVTDNGGTVWNSFDALGIVVAHSTDTGFAGKVRQVSGVQQVGATRTVDLPANYNNPPIPQAKGGTPGATETVQANIKQIKADAAWATTEGAGVVIGNLDTGVDDTHGDLSTNFDKSKSVSCAYGKPDTRDGAWRDVGTHGTHTAGIAAAARNGKGILGVAPKATLASVRIAEAGSQLFFAENTICGFVWAADHGINVTNNSYYTDPWWANCPNDPDQKAIIEGVRRATDYAEGKGLVNPVAAGNENKDLNSKGTDSSSPNDGSGTKTRQLTADCIIVPGELPAATTIGSITSSNQKSSFSNYGAGKIAVVAPGDGINSTIPGGYSGMSGTSMATPHVAGVAALIKAACKDLTAAQIRAKLKSTADSLGNTGTFGSGRVNAQRAVADCAGGPGGSWSNPNDVAIADKGPAALSPVSVTGQTGNAAATTKVQVAIKHSYRGDLLVHLVAPDGTSYKLKDANSGDAADDVNETYTVDASAEAKNGDWKLSVQDIYSSDTGYIDSWTLSF